MLDVAAAGDRTAITVDECPMPLPRSIRSALSRRSWILIDEIFEAFVIGRPEIPLAGPVFPFPYDDPERRSGVAAMRVLWAITWKEWLGLRWKLAC